MVDITSTENTLIEIWDPIRRQWLMQMSNPKLELFGSAFWKENDLDVAYIIQLYKSTKPNHCTKQYLVICYKFLFRKKLNPSEVDKHAHLHINKEDSRHFEKADFGGITNRVVSIFDKDNEWKMKIIYYEKTGALKLARAWRLYCSIMKLKAEDSLDFYKSTIKDHYLIRIHRNEVGLDAARSGLD